MARAVAVSLVPLLPSESRDIFDGVPARADLDPADERIAVLVARGTPTRAIAHEVGLSPRSVERRLARLRRRWGVRTTAQLTAELARSGL